MIKRFFIALLIGSFFGVQLNAGIGARNRAKTLAANKARREAAQAKKKAKIKSALASGSEIGKLSMKIKAAIDNGLYLSLKSGLEMWRDAGLDKDALHTVMVGEGRFTKVANSKDIKMMLLYAHHMPNSYDQRRMNKKIYEYLMNDDSFLRSASVDDDGNLEVMVAISTASKIEKDIGVAEYSLLRDRMNKFFKDAGEAEPFPLSRLGSM